MRLIQKSAAAMALLMLAGCAGSGDSSKGSARGSSDNAGGPGGVERVFDDPAKVTLQSAGISDTVYFDYDKATLRPDALPALQRIAEWMKQNPGVQIRIAGHADERGTREYNLALGDRRATAVRGYLVSLGIPAQRLETMSYGKERPVATGSNEAAWAKNRRAVAEIE